VVDKVPQAGVECAKENTLRDLTAVNNALGFDDVLPTNKPHDNSEVFSEIPKACAYSDNETQGLSPKELTGNGPDLEMEDISAPYHSRRDEEPLNEYTSSDFNLCCAFPHVFIKGNGYNHCIGNLGTKRMKHLLYQFTNIPAQDRDLLGYLHDIKQRHESVAGICNSLKKRRSAIKEFQQLRQDPDFKKELYECIKDPESKNATLVLARLMKVLNFAGRKTAYGAVEKSVSITKLMEMGRRFGSPSIFVTISPDDLNNPFAYRLTFRSIDNKMFPAHLSGETTNNDPNFDAEAAFLTDLEKHTTFEGIGVVKPCSLKDRSVAAINNPVAYMTEYKRVLIDVLSILLGIPPQNISTSTTTIAHRRTYYIGDGTHKGIFGNLLAYYGVNEDHKRGTFHNHIMCFGSLSPLLLQQAAGIEKI
jgi:hypothetical protein